MDGTSIFVDFATFEPNAFKADRTKGAVLSSHNTPRRPEVNLHNNICEKSIRRRQRNDIDPHDTSLVLGSVHRHRRGRLGCLWMTCAACPYCIEDDGFKVMTPSDADWVCASAGMSLSRIAQCTGGLLEVQRTLLPRLISI